MSESVIQNRAGFDRIQWAIVFRALRVIGQIVKHRVFWQVAPMVASMSGTFARRSPTCCFSWQLVS
jgi:hypothetical protein